MHTTGLPVVQLEAETGGEQMNIEKQQNSFEMLNYDFYGIIRVISSSNNRT